MSIDRSPARRWCRPVLVAGMALAVLALAVPAVRHLREAPPAPARPTLRLAWPVPTGVDLHGAGHPFGLALSPDGRYVAIAGTGGGAMRLHEQATGETREWPGTEGGHQPFWAPDGGRLGFFADGELRVIARDREAAITLAPAPDPHGGVWGPGDEVLFAPGGGGVMQVAATGGPVQSATSLDRARGDTSHRFPQLTGDGRLVIASVTSTDPSRAGLWAFTRATGEATRLDAGATHALVTGDDVVRLSEEALVVQRIDRRTGRLGRPRLLTLPVGRGPRGEVFATLASSWLLLAAPPVPQVRTLQWFTREGAPDGPRGEATAIGAVRIGPDGRQVAIVQPEPMLGTLDVWVMDGDARPRRLSPSIDADDHPVWAPDGARIAWVNGGRAVVVRGALGELEEDTVWRANGPARLSDWTDEGSWLVVTEQSAASGLDLRLVSPRDGTVREYLATPFNESDGVVSPDGGWMAYVSDASGVSEVYLDRFPAPGSDSRVQVTSGGGREPRWGQNGRTIFVRRDREILAVPVLGSGTGLRTGEPARMLEAPAGIASWDASRDGRRLLIVLQVDQPGPRSLTMLVNW